MAKEFSVVKLVELIVAVVGVIVVAWGVLVAKDTLVSIEKSVAIAGKAVGAQQVQLKLSREQFTASLDALWLDQRPWLGFSREESVPEEIDLSSGGIFRFHVLNSGKTPAFNVKLLQSRVEVVGNTAPFSEPSDSDWIPVPRANATAIYADRNETTTVFPSTSVHYDIRIRPVPAVFVRLYTAKSRYIAVTVRLKYCDANRSLHWTRLAVGKTYSEPDLAVRHSAASLHPGEPDHPYCQDAASD